MHFSHIAFGRLQFLLGEDIVDVTGDDRLVTAKQSGHVRLRQPDNVPVQPHLEADLAVGRPGCHMRPALAPSGPFAEIVVSWFHLQRIT